MATEDGTIEVESVTLTNEEMFTQFCTQNKVTKTAADKLLKWGFNSLEALKLGRSKPRKKILCGQWRLCTSKHTVV